MSLDQLHSGHSLWLSPLWHAFVWDEQINIVNTSVWLLSGHSEFKLFLYIIMNNLASRNRNAKSRAPESWNHEETNYEETWRVSRDDTFSSKRMNTNTQSSKHWYQLCLKWSCSVPTIRCICTVNYLSINPKLETLSWDQGSCSHEVISAAQHSDSCKKMMPWSWLMLAVYVASFWQCMQRYPQMLGKGAGRLRRHIAIHLRICLSQTRSGTHDKAKTRCLLHMRENTDTTTWERAEMLIVALLSSPYSWPPCSNHMPQTFIETFKHPKPWIQNSIIPKP